jgi:hypothetical protein
MNIMNEESELCTICEKKIDEDKDDYEETTIYLEGNFEDFFTVHTECRYNEEQRAKQLEKKDG